MTFYGSGTYTSSSNTFTSWAPQRAVEQEEDALLVGNGPPEASSSTELSVLPGIVWDVNGYYRELGVLTNASRKQLRLAYVAKNGPNDERLTYCFKQLLDSGIRFAYDCTPLGELFMDKYVEAMLRQKIISAKAQRISDLRDAGVDPDSIDDDAIERDVAEQMGLVEEEEDTPDETVDVDPSDDQDEPVPFLFSYYLWRTRVGAERAQQVLSEWQALLASELSREGIRIRFAVGLLDRVPHRFAEAKVGYRTVFFLNVHEAPTREMAQAVVRGFTGRPPAAPAVPSHSITTPER